MDENTLSYKLNRINDTVARIRTKTNTPNDVIEDVATAVENMTIPTGTIDITENGIYDVTDKSNANVNVTSGKDLSEYFFDTIEAGDSTTLSCGKWAKNIKKLPAFAFNGISTQQQFVGFKGEEIDFSNFDTSNVTIMQSMFESCSLLTSLNLSTFDTSKVTNMRYMFRICSSLTSLDLSNFNTSSVTKMTAMFQKCSSLISLNLSSFNTSNVTDMQYMFEGCSSLTSLDLSSFNTSNVTNMSYMFQSCSSLNNLNISNFDFSKVTSYSYMFANVPSNCYILVKDATAKDWITSKFTNLTNVHYVGEIE